MHTLPPEWPAAQERLIGFPTPVPQSVSEVQLIRGGSSLLYGPEPAPAVNFVTKHPVPGTPWSAYFEQTGGGNSFYNTYAAVEEAAGPKNSRPPGRGRIGRYHVVRRNADNPHRVDSRSAANRHLESLRREILLAYLSHRHDRPCRAPLRLRRALGGILSCAKNGPAPGQSDFPSAGSHRATRHEKANRDYGMVEPR